MAPISPADLFLSPDLTDAQAHQYLQAFGFRDVVAADDHLQAIADDPSIRETMGALAASLLEAFRRAPDPDAAVVGFSRYVATRYPKVTFLRYLIDDPRALGLLIEVLGTSPYLREILIRNPEYLHWLVGQVDRRPPRADEIAQQVRRLLDGADAESGDLDRLKRFKRRELLRIASRDILGRETLESTTAQLSNLADVIVAESLHIAERQVLAKSSLDRLRGRFVVIGMGKLGGGELNYSSDIDLMFVYDPEDQEDQGAHTVFHKLGRALVSAMTEFTDEGYLYRVDLRLRPMGRRGNIAYSLREYVQYYATWGETFERFALIKARPLAGYEALGRHFIESVQPFVYRKYLDHAALEEIFRYKERIKQSQADTDRDVKRGRGGIREIELFTQAFQLTYGAEHPSVREANTLRALQALTGHGLVTEEVRHDLSRAYVFLRTVEHRLQMVEELQTHTLAGSADDLEISARRLGFEHAAALETELKTRRDRVHEIYNTVFERRAGSSDFKSRQFLRVLKDEATDAEAMELLSVFPDADRAATLEVIRALDDSTALSPSRASARNVLANLLAVLLDRLARSASPHQLVVRFSRAAERTGAPVPFFRALLENDALRELLISTLDLGDLPAARLTRYPELLDSLLFRLPDHDELAARYHSTLAQIEPDKRREELHRFKAVEELKILVDWVGDGSLSLLQERLSLLADSCVSQAAAWHADRSEWVIVALGKLGGRELTVHSDLDLVVIYRGDPSDASTFLEQQHFVGQMVDDLEELTDHGVAYRVDTRLRPEGKKGALAMPVGMFQRYLESRGEIWERLAWTRYRIVTGSVDLAREVDATVRAFVYGLWDPSIPQTMADIRRRMERQLADQSGQQLEFKVGRGGLVDIDFLLQMIQIREGATRSGFRIAGTRLLLDQLPETSFLTAAEGDRLREADAFLRKLETLARLEMDTNLSAIPSDPNKLIALGRRLQLTEPAGEALVEMYRRETDSVRAIYDAVLARLS